MQRFVNTLLDRSWLVVAGFALVTLVFGFGLTRITLDDSLEAMFPDDSPVTQLNDRVEETFGSGELTIAVLEGDIYSREALLRLDQLTKELEEINGVQRVTSVANAQRMEDDDDFLLIEDLVDPATLDEDAVEEVRQFLETSYLYRGGLLVSEEGDFATIVMQIDDDREPDRVVRSIQDVLDSWPGEVNLAGASLINVEMRDTMSRDLPLLTGLAALLIVVMLYLNFRTARGALLPLLTVTIGLVWSLGTMGLVGANISVLNIIGPVAILAVGSSFSLHLLGRYYFELAQGASKRKAIHLAVTETGLGVLISGLAISAAMCTFYLSDMAAVRVLGLLTAGGVLSTLIATLLLLPAVLNLLTPPKRLPDPENPGPIGGFLRALAGFVSRARWGILVVAGLLLAFAVFGTTRIVPNTAILNYFREESAVRQGYDVVEEQFGGSSQIQVLVEGDLNDPELLRAMLDFQEQTEAIDGVGLSTSIATVVRAIHETLTGETGLPDSREEVAQELLVYQLSGDVQDITQFMTLDARQGLINITTTSKSTGELHRVYGEVREAAQRAIGDRAELGYTGLSLLQLAIEEALQRDFIISLSLAIVLVVLIDSMVRSLRAALVTILALLLTIALQYGILGYLGIPLDLATMLLGALAIGVGDYAIHLTVRYMEERRKGLAPEPAIEESIYTSGRSILFTALTLGAGFAALITSQFVPIRTLGFLMTFTVVSVGVMSLTLLPAACLIFLRNPQPAKHTQ